jgi:hypothetical protein
MRKSLTIAALVAALTIPGIPVLADDGSGTCPHPATGAEFGAHVAGMARAGHLGADMNPGTHRGHSPMAQ